MAAMRDLAEQIHGLQVDSNTTVIDLVVQNDTFRGVVAGTIRGARTVRSTQLVLTPMKWFLKLIGKPSAIYCKQRGKRCSVTDWFHWQALPVHFYNAAGGAGRRRSVADD